jgi:14-3-3 protein epsilon
MSMEEKIFLARVAEQAEKFDDMVQFLNEAINAKAGEDFTIDERNLLSVGFKNQIGANRGAIRTIGAIEQNPKYQKFGEALKQYKTQIEQSLYEQCMAIVSMVKNHCIGLAKDDESKAFFQKMIGDYYRYVAESAAEDKVAQVRDGALEGYGAASNHAQSLNACNPIRLGLALNYSVFQYEVMNDHKKACELGESALTEALEKIDDVDEETFRDAKSIIELLKENLSLWKEEEGDNAVEDL